MNETFVFNAPTIKTEETNVKQLYIWPRDEEDSRVDILDLINAEEYYHPFKVTVGDYVEAAPATGWFVPDLLVDNTILINGIAYQIIPTENKTNVELFNELINTSEIIPVRSTIDGNKIILTAYDAGESGNEILISCQAEPENIENTISGATLSGGKNGYFNTSICGGIIYLPNNEVCIIPHKENFELPETIYNPSISLQLSRDPNGNVSYKFDVIGAEELEDTIIIPTEIIE